MARTAHGDLPFALTAILTLALGIGASTAMFSVVRGILLNPIPHAESGRAVAMNTWRTDTGRVSPRVSGPDWADLAKLTDVFEASGRFHGGLIGIQMDGRAEFANLYLTPPGFFHVFDVTPVRGRLPGEPDVLRSAVVSASFARRVFGGEHQALGRTLTYDTNVREVIGVLPDSFVYPPGAEVWDTVTTQPENKSRSAGNYYAVAKLREGVTLEAAQARVATLAAQLEASENVTNKNKSFRLVPLHEQIAGNARSTILLLLGAVATLLLIACANVAHLLLARAAARTRDYGVRIALGASRTHLLQEALRSALAIAIPAAVLGVALSWGLLRALIWLNPSGLPRLAELKPDWTLLAVAVGITLVCSLLFGIAPAWYMTRMDAQTALRQSGGRSGSAGTGAARLRNLLVVGEVAFSFALAMGAGLLFRSFLEMNTVSLGYKPESILVTYAHAPANTMPEMIAATRRFDGLVERIRQTPGVTSASAAMGVPSGRYHSNGLYFVEGAGDDPRQAPSAGFSLTGPDYFRTLGIPLVEGRDFNPRDQYDTPFVAIVSQSLARRSFGNESPIGRRVKCGLDSDKWMTIVGVVGDVRNDSPATRPGPELYMPFPQHPSYANEIQLVLRTESANPRVVQDTVERLVRAADSRIAIQTTTLTTMKDERLAMPRFRTFLLGAFAAFAVLLSMSGIYALMSWQVTRRTSELGVRMALGASPGRVVGLVLRWAGMLTGVGLVAGIGLSAASSKLFESVLFGLSPADALTWVCVMTGVTLTGLGAALVPAWRAARIQPTAALRQE